MFEGLKPEVEALLNAAGADLATAQADAGLLAAMTEAVSETPLSVASPTPRRKSVLGKLITAKAAVLGGVLILSASASSAATGNLPDPAQDAASSAAEAVGLRIPKSDKKEKKEKQEQRENHGKDVSGVARDKSGEDDGANHGSVVCEVASDGKCKPNADDHSSNDDPADKRQDGTHRNENSVKDDTTSTPDDPETENENEAPADQGQDRGRSDEQRPSDK